MKNKVRNTVGMILIAFGFLTGCNMIASDTPIQKPTDEQQEIKIHTFIAASLSGAMEEIATIYQETYPNVKIIYNADSSGTLMQQIQEGASCDIFFSAANKQMQQLEEDGLIVEGSRVDLLGNKVVLITGKHSNTQVTGFGDMEKASSFALADGSVPVGKYTRAILVNSGIVPETQEVAKITSNEISQAFGDLEINECSNVSKVKEAVKEGANEIGTVYYSDAYSVKDEVTILAEADVSLSGEIVYPVALVKNEEATQEQTQAAKEFLQYLQTDEAKHIFETYMFTVSW